MTPTLLRFVSAALLAGAPAFAHNLVLAPNGGESFQAGESVSVEWTVTIEHALVDWDVFYSTSGASGPWVPIALGVAAGDPSVGSAHSVDWIVPGEISATARVRVVMNGVGGGSWEDVSDGDFALTASLGVRGCAGQTPNSTGVASTLHLVGSDVASDNALTLAVVDLPPSSFGLALNSDTAAFVPMAGGGQGTLCLGGSIGRHVTHVSSASAVGHVAVPIDLTALPRGAQSIVAMAGQTYAFQWWHRDVNPSATSNFSDSATLTLL